MAHDQFLRRRRSLDYFRIVYPKGYGGGRPYRMIAGAKPLTFKSGSRFTRTDMIRHQRVKKYGVDPWYESLR